MFQSLSQKTFRIGFILALIIALAGLVLYIMGAFMGNDLILPVHTIPTYIKTPLFFEYFQAEGSSFGVNIDQVLIWQHFGTSSRFEALSWLAPSLLWVFLASLIIIAVTLTYLDRFLYLFCTGLLLFALMQLNLNSLGVLPDTMSYLILLIFGGSTYFFQSIKPHLSLFTRTVTIAAIYIGFTVTLGALAEVPVIEEHVLAFGLYVPLIIIGILMVFIGADNVYSLFRITTHNAPSGKNGLIHFMSSGLVYILVLLLLFLNKIKIIELDLFLINPYFIFAIALVSGYYSLDAKMAIAEANMPLVLIKKWLYPALAGLSLMIIGYAELSGNDMLSEVLQMSILATQLGGAIVFYLYSFINFTPGLLSDESVSGDFFKGERAPLLTARILHIIAIVGIFLYLEKGPFYQVRAARYTALGAMALKSDNDILAKEYFKQASFNDYYNFKANYALAMQARQDGNYAEVIEKLTNAAYRDQTQKSRLALANYFSEKNQLFRKLITLQEAASDNDYLLNNQAIAHFEFQQYDSAFIALGQMKGNTKVATANNRALDYYVMNDPALGLPDTDLTHDNLSLLTNTQALANKLQLPLEVPIELSRDTVLLQDELFLLYNKSLNLAQGTPQNTFMAIDYYLTNDRNNALRDFLMLGRALLNYRTGEVNKAFTDLNQLSALYPGKRGLYTYLMALWSARQGAPIDSQKYLNDAAARGYDTAAVRRLQSVLDNESVPVINHAEEWPVSEPGNNSKEDRVDMLKSLAMKNTFNTAMTIKAINALKSEGLPASELYEFLRQAVSINRYDLELTQAYAHYAIESGLGSFGRTALEDLRPYTDPALFAKALEDFDVHQEEWLNRPLD